MCTEVGIPELGACSGVEFNPMGVIGAAGWPPAEAAEAAAAAAAAEAAGLTAAAAATVAVGCRCVVASGPIEMWAACGGTVLRMVWSVGGDT